MAIRTRPIRDVLVKREVADDAAASDVATPIGEVLAAQINRQFADADAKAAQRQAQLYRFILLVGAAITTITSIAVAVT